MSKIILINIALLTMFSCGKLTYLPLNSSANLAIKDGEFLHYVQYAGGEKNKDVYFVTKIISNQSKYAKIYQQGISPGKNEKLPSYYTNYLVHYLVSLNEGSLIESEGTYSTNRNRDNEPSVFSEQFYWHYRINSTDGVFEAENKLWNGYEVKARKERINLKPGYPVWDMISGSFFGPRFMDISRPGVAYYIIPEFLKDPLPVIYRNMGKEKINTKAGTFNTHKYHFVAADPFLGKLMESIAKDTYFWVDDSDKKFIVKFQSMGYIMMLEEISYFPEK